MPIIDDEQDWGLRFPPEKIEEMKERTKLKRLATVEVSSSLYATVPITHANATERKSLSRCSASPGAGA